MPGWDARLRDGAAILIRPIAPDDRDELAAGMHRLSEESRYRRFFSPTSELSESQLTYLTDVDHRDHEALVAVEPDTGHGIGVARFVRSRDDPELAEVAVAVADSWQGRGVATVLLDRLTQRAREEGVRRFSADVLSDNRPMLELIDELGDAHVVSRDHGSVAIEVELPPEGIGAVLREALRAAARDLVRVPHLFR